MTSREIEEYRALRDTIRERGTARQWVVVVGLLTWVAAALAVDALQLPPVSTLLPLLLLASVFEVVFALHTAVERVGRYLQVFFESEADLAAWEQVAMSYGRTYGGGGIDALFSPIFVAASVLNLLPLLNSGPAALDWVLVAALHLSFMLRIALARQQSGRQRAVDLERFTRLRHEREARVPSTR